MSGSLRIPAGILTSGFAKNDDHLVGIDDFAPDKSTRCTVLPVVHEIYTDDLRPIVFLLPINMVPQY